MSCWVGVDIRGDGDQFFTEQCPGMLAFLAFQDPGDPRVHVALNLTSILS